MIFKTNDLNLGYNFELMTKISRNKVSIYKSKEEFKIMDERVKMLCKPDLNTYLRGEIHKLLKRFNEYPDLIIKCGDEKKIGRAHYIQDTTKDALLHLSVLMKKPVSAIIDDYIITPLLSPNFAVPQD